MERFVKIVAIFGGFSGIDALACYIAKLNNPEIELKTLIFWGIVALAIVSAIFGCILKSSTSQLNPEARKHRSKNHRKLKYRIDCRAKDDGRENDSVFLNCRHSTLEYCNKDRTEIRHKKEFDVTARINNVRGFTDRYRYSGDQIDPKHENGICELTAPHGQVIKDIEKFEGWIFYTIGVKRKDALREKQTKKFEMTMKPITDSDHRMEPYLSSGIYEPTKRLELELKYPAELNLTEPKVKVYNNYSSGIEIDIITPREGQIEDGNVSRQPEYGYDFCWKKDEGKLYFFIEYPIYGYKYRMEWDFVSNSEGESE